MCAHRMHTSEKRAPGTANVRIRQSAPLISNTVLVLFTSISIMNKTHRSCLLLQGQQDINTFTVSSRLE